jgi:hypothetical protein
MGAEEDIRLRPLLGNQVRQLTDPLRVNVIYGLVS